MTNEKMDSATPRPPCPPPTPDLPEKRREPLTPAGLREIQKAFIRGNKSSAFFNRDYASKIGGIGCCGRRACCCSWLKQPNAIKTSMKMAKIQNIPLDPEAILGFCQNIKCCVAFEHGTPESIISHARPDVNASPYLKRASHMASAMKARRKANKNQDDAAQPETKGNGGGNAQPETKEKGEDNEK